MSRALQRIIGKKETAAKKKTMKEPKLVLDPKLEAYLQSKAEKTSKDWNASLDKALAQVKKEVTFDVKDIVRSIKENYLDAYVEEGVTTTKSDINNALDDFYADTDIIQDIHDIVRDYF